MNGLIERNTLFVRILLEIGLNKYKEETGLSLLLEDLICD